VGQHTRWPALPPFCMHARSFSAHKKRDHAVVMAGACCVGLGNPSCRKIPEPPQKRQLATWALSVFFIFFVRVVVARGRKKETENPPHAAAFAAASHAGAGEFNSHQHPDRWVIISEEGEQKCLTKTRWLLTAARPGAATDFFGFGKPGICSFEKLF
jgi:hypothetical protein